GCPERVMIVRSRVRTSGVLAGHQVDPAGGGAVEFEQGGAFVGGEDGGRVGLLGGGAHRDLPLGGHQVDLVAGGQGQTEVGLEGDRASSRVDGIDDTADPVPVARLNRTTTSFWAAPA